MAFRTDRIELGHVALDLVRPLSTDDLVDEQAFAESEYLPYWAELWPSGHALARLVARLPLETSLVLELGCGLGLPSLVAASRGARVLATDWAVDALTLLEQNAVRNGLEVESALVDWRDPLTYPLHRFDLVLASDVLYEARNVAPLLDVLAETVATSGRALVLDPGRRHAVGFAEAASARGWEVTRDAVAALPRGTVFGLTRS